MQGDGLAHGDQATFRGSVGCPVLERAKSYAGSDVDYGPTPGLPKKRKRRPDHIEWTEKIDGDIRAHHLQRGFVKACSRCDPRSIDDTVQTSKLFRGYLNRGSNIVCEGYINL